MQHIHQQGGIETRVAVRNRLAVELRDSNPRRWPHQHVNPGEAQVWPHLCDGRRQRAVATTDIQHPPRKLRCQALNVLS